MGFTLEWIKSYLLDSLRTQPIAASSRSLGSLLICYFDGVASNICNATCGVMQGSIFVPLLFIAYMNDIFNVSDYFFFAVVCADDKTIPINGNKCIVT